MTRMHARRTRCDEHAFASGTASIVSCRAAEESLLHRPCYALQCCESFIRASVLLRCVLPRYYRLRGSQSPLAWR